MQMPSFFKASISLNIKRFSTAFTVQICSQTGWNTQVLRYLLFCEGGIYRTHAHTSEIRPSYPFHTAFLFRNFITNKMEAQQYNISRISSVRQAERDMQLMTSCISATVSEITTKVTIKLHGFGNWKSHGLFYT